jgi:hypothetical protein
MDAQGHIVSNARASASTPRPNVTQTGESHARSVVSVEILVGTLSALNFAGVRAWLLFLALQTLAENTEDWLQLLLIHKGI